MINELKEYLKKITRTRNIIKKGKDLKIEQEARKVINTARVYDFSTKDLPINF